jgi:hypothetical protein
MTSFLQDASPFIFLQQKTSYKMKTMILSLCLTMASFISYAQVPSYIDTNGLVAYYGFNGNANDNYIHGYNGTNYGATLDTDRFENANSAYRFDGSVSYIQSPVNQTNIYQYSISAWFKTDSGGTMVSGWTAPTDIATTLYMHNIHTDPSAIGAIGYKADGNSYAAGQTTDTNYNDNKWHHAVGVWSGPVGGTPGITATDFTLYIDGIAVAQSNEVYGSHNAPISGTIGTFIGKHIAVGTAWNSYFKGKLDDVALYSRALTACEVQQLYHGKISNPAVDTVTSGGNALFSVFDTLTGISFQWQVDTGTGYYNLANGGVYSGVTTDTLRITGAIHALDSNSYRCYMTSSSCHDTSTASLLIVDTTVTTVIGTISKNEFAVFPVPANDIINIVGRFTITEMLDLTGRVILKTDNQKIFVKEIPSGSYLLKIATQNGYVLRKVSIIH